MDTDSKPSPATEQSKDSRKPSFLKLMLSASAAAFGVQNRKNLEQDFAQASPMPFIAAGILFTVVFIGILVLIVKVVLSNI